MRRYPYLRSSPRPRFILSSLLCLVDETRLDLYVLDQHRVDGWWTRSEFKVGFILERSDSSVVFLRSGIENSGKL